MRHPLQQLLDIIEEEHSIMEPEDDIEERTKNNLESAHYKIKQAGITAQLTQSEKRAVKYALEDVGELYRFTGTCAGFGTDGLTKADIKEHRSRGNKALDQAATLGIHVGYTQ